MGRVVSFGNRFFISLYSGIFWALPRCSALLPGGWEKRRVRWRFPGTAISLFVLWNIGFYFPMGNAMVPAREEFVARDDA